MRTATISKLKASLSQFLARVKAGEEVLVTERGKPVAKIIPLDRGDTEISAHILTLERAGMASVGTGKLPKDFWNLPRPKDKKGSALKNLLEDREQGR